MKIVMEKNRTNREIREALRDAYEQVAEASADALMFDFEAENLEVEDYLVQRICQENKRIGKRFYYSNARICVEG